MWSCHGTTVETVIDRCDSGRVSSVALYGDAMRISRCDSEITVGTCWSESIK